MLLLADTVRLRKKIGQKVNEGNRDPNKHVMMIKLEQIQASDF